MDDESDNHLYITPEIRIASYKGGMRRWLQQKWATKDGNAFVWRSLDKVILNEAGEEVEE